jgi:hypothetical protein
MALVPELQNARAAIKKGGGRNLHPNPPVRQGFRIHNWVNPWKL